MAIQNDKSLASSFGKSIHPSDSACPALSARTCCDVSYCRQIQSCPPLPLECNSQNDLKFCFQYSWKNISNDRPGLCKDCNSANLDAITYKTYQACALKK